MLPCLCQRGIRRFAADVDAVLRRHHPSQPLPIAADERIERSLRQVLFHSHDPESIGTDPALHPAGSNRLRRIVPSTFG